VNERQVQESTVEARLGDGRRIVSEKGNKGTKQGDGQSVCVCVNVLVYVKDLTLFDGRLPELRHMLNEL
jgi:hypothetical protein